MCTIELHCRAECLVNKCTPFSIMRTLIGCSNVTESILPNTSFHCPSQQRFHTKCATVSGQYAFQKVFLASTTPHSQYKWRERSQSQPCDCTLEHCESENSSSDAFPQLYRAVSYRSVRVLLYSASMIQYELVVVLTFAGVALLVQGSSAHVVQPLQSTDSSALKGI